MCAWSDGTHVEIQRAAQAVSWNDLLTVMPTIFPISRPAFEMRDGENDNFVFPHQVDNREGKLFGKHASSSMLVWRSSQRQRCRQFHSGLNGLRNRSPRPTWIVS